MNTKLVESLAQIIQSLSTKERLFLEEKLFSSIPYPSSIELEKLAQNGGVFDFLDNEPDLYTLDDGEPNEWR